MGDDILFISQYHWEGVWRRNQHVAKHLSRCRQILYFTPFPAHLVSKFPEYRQNTRGRWVQDRIFSVSFPIIVGENKFPVIRRINQLSMISSLIWTCLNEGMAPGLLWFSHPFAESITRFWRDLPVVYDVQDEYPAIPSAPRDVSDREISLLRRADVVFTGTYSLYLKKKRHSRNIHFVPCGVDFEHFNRACEDSLEIPGDMAAIVGEKILGYFGEVGDRIDWPLLREICYRHPRWHVVLIGGVSRIGPDVAGLENIHFMGKRDYGELPNYIKAFDVCLIPFKSDELTRYIYPTKLLEYLSAGKPVISSPIPDVKRFFSGVVGVAEDVDEFERVMERIGEDRERVRKGMELARQASWESAVSSMEELLRAAISRQDGGREENG